jgi:hypothetical protein
MPSECRRQSVIVFPMKGITLHTLSKAWTRFDVKWTVHYAWTSPGSFICTFQFFLIRLCSSNILCLYLVHNSFVFSSLLSLLVDVCVLDRYTIDNAEPYLLITRFTKSETDSCFYLGLLVVSFLWRRPELFYRTIHVELFSCNQCCILTLYRKTENRPVEERISKTHCLNTHWWWWWWWWCAYLKSVNVIVINLSRLNDSKRNGFWITSKLLMVTTFVFTNISKSVFGYVCDL